MFEVSKRAVEKATGTLWPTRSIVTNRPAGNGACLTPEDFRALEFIAGPICQRCGVPQEIGGVGEFECASCIAREPLWDSARAALVYAGL